MPFRKTLAIGCAVGAIAAVGALLALIAPTPLAVVLAIATVALLLASGPLAARISRAHTLRITALVGLVGSAATFVTFPALVGLALVVTWSAFGEPMGGMTGLWLIGFLLVDPLVPITYCAFGALAASLYRWAADRRFGP